MAEHRHEMPFAFDLMRPQAGSFRQSAESRREDAGSAGRHRCKLRVPDQKLQNRPFILLRSKGAGRVDNRSARFQRFRRCAQNLSLHIGVLPRSIRLPLFDHILVLAEHPFA
ncbi:hypothetical protein D3C73_1003250 [compost metagenome]